MVTKCCEIPRYKVCFLYRQLAIQQRCLELKRKLKDIGSMKMVAGLGLSLIHFKNFKCVSTILNAQCIQIILKFPKRQFVISAHVLLLNWFCAH